MKTLAIFNQKGGVGKTSLSFHLAWYLAEIGKRTLLIDLDPQGNLSSLFEASGSLASQVFAGGGEPVEPQRVERTTPRGTKIALSLIPSDETLQAYEATTNGIAGLTRLRKTLRALEGRFDHCVIDCPPSLGGFSANAIVACDGVIVPCTVRQFSLIGLEHVNDAVAATREEGLNPQARILAVVLNQFNSESKRKTVFERDIFSEVEGKWGNQILPSTIPQSIKIEEALYAKLPVWEYAHGTRDDSARAAGQNYRNVVSHLVARLEDEATKEGEAA